MLTVVAANEPNQTQLRVVAEVRIRSKGEVNRSVALFKTIVDLHVTMVTGVVIEIDGCEVRNQVSFWKETSLSRVVLLVSWSVAGELFVLGLQTCRFTMTDMTVQCW